MLEIFKMQCNKGCYELGDGVEQQLREFIAEENTNSISFGNARGVRNLFERILVNQANRLAALDTVTREDLMKITTRDVALARGLEEESCAAQEGTPDTPEGREMAQESKLDTPPSGGLGEDLK